MEILYGVWYDTNVIHVVLRGKNASFGCEKAANGYKQVIFMKRWQKILIEVMVGIVLILVILKVIEKWTGVNPIDNLRYRAEAMSDINEVASALTQEMADGKDGEVVLYIKDIPEDDLMNINYIMSNLEGSVDSFQVHAKIFGVQRVVFQIVRSDNSYVYDAYAKGIPIPEDRPEAQKLYKVVKKIIETQIGDRYMTEFDKEVALHDYLLDHCTYSFGSDKNDNEYRAYGALIEQQAVCNGYAEAMALLLSCAGVENRYVVGTVNSGSRSATAQTTALDSASSKRENHAWNQVKLNGTWYHLDATWDDPVGEREVVSHAYFNLSDEMMERDHIWKKEKYESCPDMNWNYFYRNQKFFQNSNDLNEYVTRMVTARPHGTLECAYAQFEMTNTTLQGLSGIPGLRSVYYSTVGNFSYSVLTLYIN